MEDRLMTSKEVAAFLNVNERTVLKLVGEGALPGVKVGNQWRFRKATLDAWLDDQMRGLAPRCIDTPQEPSPRPILSLSACFEPRYVIAELHSKTKAAVIVELAEFAHRLGLVRDETWFVGALIQREHVMPSAVGNGLALLHTLRCHPEQIVRPFMLLGRSREGLSFDAIDGQPVHLFFVLGLKYEELRLPWLARLVQMLAKPESIQPLLRAPDAQVLFSALLEAERKLGPVPAATEG